MKNLLTFLKNLFLSDKAESSKRFFGAIGFICFIVFVAVWDHSLIDTLGFLSVSLIGLETITTAFKPKQ